MTEAQEPGAAPLVPLLEDDEDDILARAGGVVLVLLGLALISLAVIFRTASTVAAPFATLGPLCVVLGVLIHRAEGLLKLAPSGLEVTLRELRKRAKRDRALHEPQKADVLAASSERLYELPPVVSAGQARTIARDLYAQARNDYTVFEERVRKWLEQQGWELQRGGGPAQVDFVGRRGSERLYAEAKYTTRPLQRIVLFDGLARVLNAVANDPGSRGMLFVAAPSVTEAARLAAEAAPIEIYVFSNDEDVERLGPESSFPSGS